MSAAAPLARRAVGERFAPPPLAVADARRAAVGDKPLAAVAAARAANAAAAAASARGGGGFVQS